MVYNWPKSTYIAEPPFFGKDFSMQPASSIAAVTGGRALGIFGRFGDDRPHQPGRLDQGRLAGRQVAEGKRRAESRLHSYGSRRGNHDVMMRGTFANVRIKNLMIPVKADGTRVEGGLTIHQPDGEQLSDLRRRDEVHRRRHADVRVLRARSTVRLVARLGGKGYATARREGCGRTQFRADSPFVTWSAWACCRCSSRARTASSRSASPAKKRTTSKASATTSSRNRKSRS